MVSSEQATHDGLADGSLLELRLTLDEARVMSEVAKRGMLVAAADGSAPGGNPSQAKAALGKLDARIADAERILSVRAELELAGLATAHLGDAQVTSLVRRLADVANGAGQH